MTLSEFDRIEKSSRELERAVQLSKLEKCKTLEDYQKFTAKLKAQCQNHELQKKGDCKLTLSAEDLQAITDIIHKELYSSLDSVDSHLKGIESHLDNIESTIGNIKNCMDDTKSNMDKLVQWTEKVSIITNTSL